MNKSTTLKVYDKNPKKKQKRVKLDNEQTKQKTLFDMWNVKDKEKNRKERKSEEQKSEVTKKEQVLRKNVDKDRPKKKQESSPWFGQSASEISEKLWVCRKADLVVTEKERWDISLKKSGQQTWFDTKHLKNLDCGNSPILKPTNTTTISRFKPKLLDPKISEVNF